MRDLIKNLQDFNRPTAGIIAPVDIHATLNSILMLSKKEYATRKIAIIKKYTDNLPQVIVVSDQLKQVFLNLLNNAFDASTFGGKITIETDFCENNIVIRIHDAGSGICLKDREHIFEPFFTTKAKMKGTGLGLSISYGIINDHGGNITVESKQGKGSIFSVFLPIKGVPNEEK
jgi:signal transduction histidine kinase